MERSAEVFRKLEKIFVNYCKFFTEITRLGDDLASALHKLGKIFVNNQAECLARYCADVGTIQEKTQVAFGVMLEKFTKVRERFDCISRKKEIIFSEVAPEMEVALFLLELAFQQFHGQTSKLQQQQQQQQRQQQHQLQQSSNTSSTVRLPRFGTSEFFADQIIAFGSSSSPPSSPASSSAPTSSPKSKVSKFAERTKPKRRRPPSSLEGSPRRANPRTSVCPPNTSSPRSPSPSPSPPTCSFSVTNSSSSSPTSSSPSSSPSSSSSPSASSPSTSSPSNSPSTPSPSSPPSSSPPPQFAQKQPASHSTSSPSLSALHRSTNPGPLSCSTPHGKASSTCSPSTCSPSSSPPLPSPSPPSSSSSSSSLPHSPSPSSSPPCSCTSPCSCSYTSPPFSTPAHSQSSSPHFYPPSPGLSPLSSFSASASDSRSCSSLFGDSSSPTFSRNSFHEECSDKKVFGLTKVKKFSSFNESNNSVVGEGEGGGGKEIKFTNSDRMFEDYHQEKSKGSKKTRVKSFLKPRASTRSSKDRDRDRDKGKDKDREKMSSPSSGQQHQLSGFVFLEDPEDDLSLVTLQDLVKGLTTRSMEVHSGLPFRTSFFLTYQRFSTPQQLLNMFKNEFFSPPDPSFQEDEESCAKKRVEIKAILKYWIQEKVFDFLEEETNKLLFSFFSEMEEITDYASFGEFLRAVYTESHRKYEEKKEKEKELEVDLPPMEISWDAFEEEELAASLTLREFDLFQKITFSELLGWNKGDREEFCPNISHLISISNKISGWVTTELVQRTRLLERVKLFEKFVTLTRHLLEMKNFSSCVAVVGGLSNSSFWRMKKTWRTANPEIVESFQKIRNLVSHHANYGRYRAFLNFTSLPCIPFIGVVLTDLTFIDDGNKDTQLGCINFQKFRLFAKVLVEFHTRLTGKYANLENLNVRESFVSALLDYPLLSENEKHQYSHYAEPKDPEEAIATLLELYLETKTQLSQVSALIESNQSS